MKTIETGGITYIDLIPHGTDEWYYGIGYEHGDLYEAEEVFRAGHEDGSNYYEETVVRSLQGEVTEVLPGDVRIMPNGEMWHIR